MVQGFALNTCSALLFRKMRPSVMEENSEPKRKDACPLAEKGAAMLEITVLTILVTFLFCRPGLHKVLSHEKVN